MTRRKPRPYILTEGNFKHQQEVSLYCEKAVRWKDPKRMHPPSYSKVYYPKIFYYEDRPDRPIQCLILINYGEGIWGDVGFYSHSKKLWCFEDGTPLDQPSMGKVVAWAEYPRIPFIFEHMMTDSEESFYRKNKSHHRSSSSSPLVVEFGEEQAQPFLECVKKHILKSIKDEKESILCKKMDALMALNQVQEEIKSILQKNLKKLQESLKNGSNE